MIKEKYTRPEKLTIQGGSNGGLLMGAMITQHPDLMRAVVSQVGIYDMLRVELAPNGAFNVTEFGTVKNPEQFKADRKSTRLNSSHRCISYAVFCLKKKR